MVHGKSYRIFGKHSTLAGENGGLYCRQLGTYRYLHDEVTRSAGHVPGILSARIFYAKIMSKDVFASFQRTDHSTFRRQFDNGQCNASSLLPPVGAVRYNLRTWGVTAWGLI